MTEPRRPVHEVIHDTLTVAIPSAKVLDLSRIAADIIVALRRNGYEIERTRWDQR